MKRLILPLLLSWAVCLATGIAFAPPSRAQTPAACMPADTQCRSCSPGAICCKRTGACLGSVSDCPNTPCFSGGTCQIDDLCAVGSADPEPPPMPCTGADTACSGCAPGAYCCKETGGCVAPGTNQCIFTPCFSAAGCDGTKLCAMPEVGPTATPAPTASPPGPTPTGPAPTPTGSSPTPTGGPTPTAGPTPVPGACRILKFVNEASEPVWIGGTGGAVVPSCITPQKSCLASVDRGDDPVSGNCSCDGSAGKLACPSGATPSKNESGALVCACTGSECGGSGSQTACAPTADKVVPNVCFWTLPVPTSHGKSSNAFELRQGETATFCIPKPVEVGGKLSPVWWSGGAFGRTGCKDDGTGCASADCGAKSNGGCPAGTGGKKPLTLSEFTLQTFEKDFYDVTIIDGVNLSVEMAPIPPTRRDVPGGADPDYWCKGAGSRAAAGNLEACSWKFDPFVPEASDPTKGTDYTSLLLYNGFPCDQEVEPTGCLPPYGSNPGEGGAGTSYCTAPAKSGGGACLYPCTSDADCHSNWGGSMKCKAVPYSDAETHKFCQCDEQSDCAGSKQGSYCGTQFVPGVKTQYMQVCGPKLRGWWAANDFCADAGTDYGPLDCDASLPNGGTGDTTLAQLFGCTGANAQSCYKTETTSANCCGCATSPSSPFAGDWPSAASLSCSRNNPIWNDHAQPWLVFLKKGCPTAYTYAFDDSTSTFTCQSEGEINQVGYTITFGSVAAPPLVDCATSGTTAGPLSSTAAERDPCTAFLSRAVGHRAGLEAGSRWSPAIQSVSDWIETADFLIKRPLGLIAREASPDDVVWLSHPLARRRGTSERPRRGIEATDELGAHALDTLGAERLLVATGTGGLGDSPEVPLAGLFDTYKCYRVKPAAGEPKPRLVAATYTDESGPHTVSIRDFPDSLCIEADVGDGVGNELANVACYRIRSGEGNAIRPAAKARLGAGKIAIARGPGDDSLVLRTASNRFGRATVERERAEEICVPIEITDRGR